MNIEADLRGQLPASGTITRLTLLAFLALRPMHGYELRKAMEDNQMNRWADIQFGSIYARLQQLTKEGLLQEVGSERAGNRPPRTVYRITEAGQDELLRLLRRAWVQPALSARPVDVALSFYMLLPFAEISRLLEERLGALHAMAEELDAVQEQTVRHQQAVFVAPGIQAMVADIFDHSRRLLASERAWTTDVLDRVRRGVYSLDEEILSNWREYDGHD